MKQKAMDFFDKISPIFDKIGANPYLQAVSGAMMATLGPVFIGSMSVLISVLLNMNQNWSEMVFIQNLSALLGKVSTFTLNAIALYLSFLMAMNVVRKIGEKEDPIPAGIVSLMAFLIVTPLDLTKDDVAALPTTWLSAQGVFSAMIIGLVVGKLFIAIKKKGWTIKMPQGVPPMVTHTFEALIPTIIISVLFMVINFIFGLTSFENIHQFIYTLIQEPLKGLGGSIWALIILSIFQQLLWFFGIHGTNVVLPIVTPIWMAMDLENVNAVAAGKVPPNILGMAFFNIITFGGLALGLVILMTFAKSKQYREIGKISLVPALFGITEPVIFGTPLVLNFDLAFPFIFNNTIALVLSYLLTQAGIVARFMGVQAIFGLPVGVHASVQGSLSIILLQLGIQFILSPLLWYPWFKRLDNKTYKQEQLAVTEGN